MDQNEEIFRARCCNMGNIVSFRARCCNMGNIVSFRARCCNMSLLVARRGDLAVSTRKTTEEAVQSGKIKERKRAQKVRSQARSFPQVPLRELGRVGRAVEEVFGGMGGCHAGGTEVIWGPAHPHQETVEGRAEARAELGESRAVRAGREDSPVWRERMVSL